MYGDVFCFQRCIFERERGSETQPFLRCLSDVGAEKRVRVSLGRWFLIAWQD